MSKTDAQIRDKIIAEARSQLGVTEHPPGSNEGPDVQKYQRATFLRGTGWPWCAAFCNWCWREAGAMWPYHSAGAYDLLNWARKNGAATDHPKPGDGVVFNVGSGHIGLFLDFAGPDVKTIDGNTSDEVALRERPRSEVRGYIDATHFRTKLAPKVKPERLQLVTSESGHIHVVWKGGSAKKLPSWAALLVKLGGARLRRR